MNDDGPWVCPLCRLHATRLYTAPAAAKMPTESPILHQQYFHSDEVQAKLRSGELEIPSKGSDMAQR